MGHVQSAWPKQDPGWLQALDWSMLGLVLPTFLLAYFQLNGHRRNPIHASLQLSYSVIICLPAVNALLNWFCVFYPHLDRFFECATSAYDSAAIISFFNILVEYPGGAQELTRVLKARDAPLSILPFPIICFRTTNHEAQMSRWRNGVIQVAAQAFWALLYAILVEFDHSDKTYFSGVIHTIMFAHVTTAMMVFLAMYLDCKDNEFKGLNMEVKFSALKLIVFGILCKMIFAWEFPEHGPRTHYGFTPKEWSTRMLARVRIFQMLLFGVAFSYIFSSDDPALQNAVQCSPGGGESEATERLMPVKGDAEEVVKDEEKEGATQPL